MLKMLFPHPSGRKNLNHVIDLSEEIISRELSSSESALCHDPIIAEEKSILFSSSNEKEAAKWPSDYDYYTFSYKLLYSVCFRLLTSGRMHLYRGFLSPAGDAVYSLYIHVLQFYEENGMLGNSCLEEQLDIVDSYIADIG